MPQLLVASSGALISANVSGLPFGGGRDNQLQTIFEKFTMHKPLNIITSRSKILYVLDEPRGNSAYQYFFITAYASAQSKKKKKKARRTSGFAAIPNHLILHRSSCFMLTYQTPNPNPNLNRIVIQIPEYPNTNPIDFSPSRIHLPVD